MAASCVMKQLQDCHMTADIVKCVWSPKMDLLATANSVGQVAMHRLTCQKVWQANPPTSDNSTDTPKVTGLAWRPDSKILAVSYTSGHILLLDIENSNEIHKITIDCEITTINWILHQSSENEGSDAYSDKDPWEKYMTPLPPLNKTYGGSDSLRGEPDKLWHETQLLEDQHNMTLLTFGAANNTIHLYAFGLFHCATFDLTASVDGCRRILDATPSQDLRMMSVIVERIGGDRECEIAQVTLETLVVSWRHRELCALAKKYGQIYTLMSYANYVLTHIEEAWESILIEMDDKLADYAKTVPEGGVSADFLDLLVFGYSTHEFETFLANKFSSRGLKKLRDSVDLSYSNIEKLVVQNLQSVGSALFFLLSQVVGMARSEDRFSMLGLNENDICMAAREAGAFLLKAIEMQQVIEVSMRDFNAFLKWLSRVVLRNLGDQVPPELSLTTQQEQSYIISFLHDSLEETVVDSDGQKRIRFCLERVGQYLKDEPLTKPYDMSRNTWIDFLSTNENLANHPLIMPLNQKHSLKQAYSSLKLMLHKMVAHPVSSISAALKVTSTVSIVALPSGVSARITQASIPSKDKIYTIVVPDNKKSLFYLSQWSTDAKHLTNNSGPGPHKHVYASPFVFSSLDHGTSRILDTSKTHSVTPLMLCIDAQFYTENTLSFLLQEVDDVKATYFVQLWIPGAIEELNPIALPEGRRLSDVGILPRDASQLLDAASHRRLELGQSSSLAVSGSRKVSVIISENKRRIRIYEMEADDDEEDEEDETQHESAINASGTSDTSEIL